MDTFWSMEHVYLIITSVCREIFIKVVWLASLAIKLLMESVESCLIIVPILTSLWTVSNVHQVTSYTMESAIRQSPTAPHKEHHIATNATLYTWYQTIKHPASPNNQSVTVNNTTQLSIFALSVLMASESPLTENVLLITALNMISKPMFVKSVQTKLSMEPIITIHWEMTDVFQSQSAIVLFL